MGLNIHEVLEGTLWTKLGVETCIKMGAKFCERVSK